MTPLPHSSQYNAELAKLVFAAVKENRKSVALFAAHDRMKQLYRTCCAMDAIIDALDDGRSRPSLQTARSVVIQLPVLLLFSLSEIGMVELRRFMEVIFWAIYFRDHPVEWKRFSSDPATGFSRDIDHPIEYCARRELSFYLNYARDLLKEEPSGIAIQAVDRIQELIRRLNAGVHAAPFANVSARTLRFKVASIDDAKKFSEITREIFRNASLILCATQRQRFDRFGPVPRAYFDQIIGNELAKKVRSGDFGLQ